MRREQNPAGNEIDRQIYNPWAGGQTVSDVFWIPGGRRHCSVLVLGRFCSILQGSTLRHKGQTNPAIHSKVFVFVLARGGCGRGGLSLWCARKRSSGDASEFSTALGMPTTKKNMYLTIKRGGVSPY